MYPAILTGLFIFTARVTDVAMGTTRIMLLVKGRRIQAAAIGFFEVIVYIVALGRVVNALDQWYYLLVYALGFAGGNLLGGYLEERMALGYVGVQIIVRSESDTLVRDLREEGFGVTLTEGWGREGPKDIITVILGRKQMPRLQQLINQHDQKAFVIVMDARKTLGGYYLRQKSK